MTKNYKITWDENMAVVPAARWRLSAEPPNLTLRDESGVIVFSLNRTDGVECAPLS